MADVFATVFEGAAEVALGDPIQYAAATIGGSNSDAIDGSNKLRRRVRLYAESNCWVKWGSSPTATGSSDAVALSGNNPEYFDIEAGHVITAITR